MQRQPWEIEWLTEGMPNGYAAVSVWQNGARRYGVVRLRAAPYVYLNAYSGDLSTVMTTWDTSEHLYNSYPEAIEWAREWAGKSATKDAA